MILRSRGGALNAVLAPQPIDYITFWGGALTWSGVVTEGGVLQITSLLQDEQLVINR